MGHRGRDELEWQEIAHDEIAVIPMVYQILSVAINKDVDGIAFEPGGIHDFSGIYRETKQPKT